MANLHLQRFNVFCLVLHQGNIAYMERSVKETEAALREMVSQRRRDK